MTNMLWNSLIYESLIKGVLEAIHEAVWSFWLALSFRPLDDSSGVLAISVFGPI